VSRDVHSVIGKIPCKKCIFDRNGLTPRGEMVKNFWASASRFEQSRPKKNALEVRLVLS